MELVEHLVTHHDQELIILELTGHLDVMAEATVEQGMEHIVSRNHTRVVMDLTQVDYASSGGLGLLLKSARQLQQLGGQLVLCNPQPMVDEILRLTRLNTVLTIAPTREAALDAFGV